MSVKNICLLNDSFPPVIDGVANAVFNYASIIEEKYGHAIVSTLAYPGVKDDYPFEVIRYASLDTTALAGYRFGIPLSISHLSEYAGKNIDILHCHCPISSMILARTLREEINRPIILHYHTKFDIDIRRAVNAKILQDLAISKLIENISYADEVWVVSEGAGENLRKLGYQGDYVIMRNGVDFEKGRSSTERTERLRKEYGITDGRPIYLFVGRLMWYKGIRILLDALKQLKDSGEEFSMLLVGDGMDRKDIEKYVQELGLQQECRFTGAIRDRETLKDLYSLADLFLFPSTFDTNGIVVSEAASSGTASVLIKGSCAAEEVTDGRNAFLIEENSASLFRMLKNIGSNRDLLRTAGENAMNDLYLSWDESVARAWKRYAIVSENYSYRLPENPEYRKPSENMLTAAAELANGLDQARKLVNGVENRIGDFLDRWL